jgi:two-component system sensor kinase FixL
MSKTTPNIVDAVRSIQLSEARWQAILDSARDAIISIDEEGRITLFNPMAERVFGYSADEVLGQNVSMLMPPPYRDEHDDYLQHYRETGIRKAIGLIRQVRAQRKNGEVFPIELSVSEALLGDERLHTAIIRDVSERERQARELQEMQRRVQQQERLADIGAITAKVVHDIKNPLAGLSMQAQLVLRRSDDERIRNSAQRILSEVRRLDSLIQEFSTFAREQRLNLRDIALPVLLESIVESWRPLAAERAIALAVALPQQTTSLRGDEEKLRRVFDNLIKNAVEAVEHGPGHVQIAVALPADERIVVEIEDSGPGIAEDLDVFKLFETTKADGTGLGLAIAREIVTAHGGLIVHGPRTPNGTIFRVELPRSGPALLRGYGFDRR